MREIALGPVARVRIWQSGQLGVGAHRGWVNFGTTASVADFGGAESAGEPFALITAEAFDPTGRNDWTIVGNPAADPVIVGMLRRIWRDEVLPKFAAHFGLAT